MEQDAEKVNDHRISSTLNDHKVYANNDDNKIHSYINYLHFYTNP